MSCSTQLVLTTEKSICVQLIGCSQVKVPISFLVTEILVTQGRTLLEPYRF